MADKGSSGKQEFALSGPPHCRFAGSPSHSNSGRELAGRCVITGVCDGSHKMDVTVSGRRGTSITRASEQAHKLVVMCEIPVDAGGGAPFSPKRSSHPIPPYSLTLFKSGGYMTMRRLAWNLHFSLKNWGRVWQQIWALSPAKHGAPSLRSRPAWFC